jgi:hypothetical protein
MDDDAVNVFSKYILIPLANGIRCHGHEFTVSKQDHPRHTGWVCVIKNRSEEDAIPSYLQLQLLYNTPGSSL